MKYPINIHQRINAQSVEKTYHHYALNSIPISSNLRFLSEAETVGTRSNTSYTGFLKEYYAHGLEAPRRDSSIRGKKHSQYPKVK